MRLNLADAIMLGSTQIKPAPGQLFRVGSNGEEGCALGMAQVAAGISPPDFPPYDYDEIFKQWPWLLAVSLTQAPLCSCIGYFNASQWIQHTFDVHIMGDETVTLEQLCDWIRAIQPKEIPADSRGASPKFRRRKRRESFGGEMKYKGNFVIIAKDGITLEEFIGKPITNFFRRLFLASHKQCRACLPTNGPYHERIDQSRCDFCREPVRGSVHFELPSGAHRCCRCFNSMGQPQLTNSTGVEYGQVTP